MPNVIATGTMKEPASSTISSASTVDTHGQARGTLQLKLRLGQNLHSSTGKPVVFCPSGSNKWIPVEAKLNVLAEQDLRSQLAKYTHLDRFYPTLGSSIGGSYPVDDESCCLVFDQSGMYVTHNGEFINCSIDKPLIRREDIQQLGTTKCRELVLRAIG